MPIRSVAKQSRRIFNSCCSEGRNLTIYFITRHAGAKDWAKRQGIRIDRFVEHLDVGDIRPGDVVMGSLPVHLAAEVCELGARYFHLILNLPPTKRGLELCANELNNFDASLREFVVSVPQHKGFES